jgi:hypothetical protein
MPDAKRQQVVSKNHPPPLWKTGLFVGSPKYRFKIGDNILMSC